MSDRLSAETPTPAPEPSPQPGPAWPESIVLAGAGKMGGAMLRGWLAGGLEPGRIAVIDPQLDAETAALCMAQGISLAPSARASEVLVLAVKPQVFATDYAAFVPLAGESTLVLSILAGVRLERLRAAVPKAGAIVRAMPNLPAAIGRGASALAGEPGLADGYRVLAETLLGAVGSVEWLDETLLDAVTAVSGSGPAYVFLLAECLAVAGAAAGLPRETAERLARATVEGAAALMATDPARTPAALREAVTSPGGTTAAALEVLRSPGGLQPLLDAAVTAAARRAADMSR